MEYIFSSFAIIMLLAINLASINKNSLFQDSLQLLLIITCLFYFYSLGVRRLHDIDISGWFVFLYPILNGLMLLGLALVSGKKGKNKYGSQPKSGVNLKNILGIT